MAFILCHYFVLLRPLFAAFLASISIFASIRFGDLYGRFEVFLFGLRAIILVMANSILIYSKNGLKPLYAPRVGFEPTTNRLTGDCSTAELSRNAPTFVSGTIVHFSSLISTHTAGSMERA